jgi:ADP-ribose pyrophosphatase YjhB (NUDIX family)
MPEVAGPAWSHAGGVVFRVRDSRAEVLLVRAKREPHDWVLPKGHIEARESPRDCARREVREEAGVDADAGLFLGTDRFTTADGRAISVAFFLMRYVGDMATHEQRDLMWCDPATARAILVYDGPRQIVDMAATHIDHLMPDRRR